MNLIATLDLAIDIEQALADCYQKMTEVFAGDPVCKELQKLGREEIGHKQLIKTGKSYALKVPEAFPKESDFYEEMKRSLSQAAPQSLRTAHGGPLALSLSLGPRKMRPELMVK